MHGDPVAPLVLSLAVLLVAAKIGGEVATRWGQPAVLGELGAGIILGNLTLLGNVTLFGAFEALKVDPTISLLAGLGVLLLLFEVGLESTVGEMLSVGGSAKPWNAEAHSCLHSRHVGRRAPLLRPCSTRG